MNNFLTSTALFRHCLVAAGLLLFFVPFATPSFAQDSGYRKWKDSTGKFEIDAKISKVEDGTVFLEKRNGSIAKVPLKKLSALDQGYIQGQMAALEAKKDANPFETVDSGSDEAESNSKAPATNSGGLRTISVDFTTCAETSIDKGKWEPKLGQQPSLSFEPKAVVLPGKKEFFEKMTGAAVNQFAKRAVLTHRFSRHGKQSYTRMELVDLATGKVLANAKGEGDWQALAIDDSGENVVVLNVSKNEETKGQLGTVRIEGKAIVPVELWKPYETMDKPEKEKVVTYAKFINDNRLLTVSQSGAVVVWNFENKKPIRRFSYHGACQPSLTNDRKHLAICGGDIVGFVNLEDEDATPSVMDAPGMNYWLSSALSPQCKRFAAATMGKLMVWDIASGKVLFDGKIPGLPTNGKLYFPHEDFVMINGNKLVEIASGIKLWQYDGGFPMSYGGQFAYAHVERDKGKLMPVSVPHPAAMELLKKAKAQSDLFILKKNADVGLDLTGVPAKYRGDVEQSLKDQISKSGFKYSSGADVILKATITGPKTEAVSYHFAGSFVVKQYRSKLEVMYQGKPAWSAGAGNIPGMVSGRGKDAIKKQLDKAGRSPNIKFFGSVTLPDFLQKPSGDGNKRQTQMLGTSRISLNGLD
jgi:hypothetical protein